MEYYWPNEFIPVRRMDALISRKGSLSTKQPRCENIPADIYGGKEYEMIENRRHKVMCQTVVETKESTWKRMRMP